LQRNESAYKTRAVVAQNLAWLEFDAGHFVKALECAKESVTLAGEAEFEERSKYSFVYRAISYFALGNIAAADRDFQHATRLIGEPLYSFWGVLESECDFLRGKRDSAILRSESSRESAIKNHIDNDLCLLNALLARLMCSVDQFRSHQYLIDAREFANRSGDVGLQLRCFHAGCELQLGLGDLTNAIAEAKAGILLAETCNFGKYIIDLSLALAETLLAAGEPRKALQNARNALDRSEALDCQYAWGKADGLHFCGVAHQRLGDTELARQRLEAALKLRERLDHGRIDETKRALELCCG
jgi:tetratricopeptide (TPR) repeat protein